MEGAVQRRERPKRLTRNRLARCAVRHAVPAPSPVGEGRGEGKATAPLSDGRSLITDNRLKTYNGTTYYYDHFGNLIHRELADGEVQNYFYDLHDQLVKAEIFKKDGLEEEPGAVIHFLNKSNGLNVITKKSDDFISGWKLNSSQLQNVVSRGAL